MNSYTQGKSGGEAFLFSWINEILSICNPYVVTSLLGQTLWKKSAPKLKPIFHITSHEPSWGNIYKIYFVRIINAVVQIFNNRFLSSKKIIHLATSDFLPDVFPIWILKKKTPHTRWIQHIYHIIPRKRIILAFFQHISFFLIKNSADVIIVDSDYVKKQLIKRGFNYKNIRVVYPGRNIQDVPKKEPVDEPNCLFLAHIRRSKGALDLIEIWRYIIEQYPKAILTIAGNGNTAIIKKMKNKIQKYHLKKTVQWLGYVNDSEKQNLFLESKLFLLPSYEEGFGIVSLEAQSYGIPVIAWDLPVYDEIFPKGMVKIPVGQIKQFSQEAILLLQNKNNYKKLFYEALSNAKRFDINKTKKEMMHIIKSTIR